MPAFFGVIMPRSAKAKKYRPMRACRPPRSENFSFFDRFVRERAGLNARGRAIFMDARSKATIAPIALISPTERHFLYSAASSRLPL